jgi:hypothetical protein
MVFRQDIERLSDIENIGDRLQSAAWMCNGNIVEIGAGAGVNTLRFLSVARERKNTVIVVDPFKQIDGASESYFKPYPKENFLNNICSASEHLMDHLRLIELPSQDERVVVELSKYMPVGFMFIDGLQDKSSVLSDLLMADSLGAEVICVDDFDRLTSTSEVPFAVAEFIHRTSYHFIDIGKREAYFIK